jgi:hypothetical protein
MTQALSPQQVAAELSIALSTARKWMLRMPGVFKVGRLPRISRLDFERWIQHRKDEQTWKREDAAKAAGGGPRAAAGRDSWSRPVFPRTNRKKVTPSK